MHHDLGEGHPLLGRRMPDLDLVTADGPRRVAPGAWELPVVGAVSAAVLIRPDGHVAWVGDGTRDGLPNALTT